MNKCLRLCIFVLALISSPLVYSSTFYVNSSAAGADDGTSWGNAFTSLTAALSSASAGDEIWVAAGVYIPVNKVDFNLSGGSDAREAVFTIPNGVKLLGGFNGTEISREERNPAVNITILSGDLEGNDKNLDGNFIAEDTSHITGCNSYHVIYTNNVNNETVIDGFVITAGYAGITSPVDAFDPNLDGGGVYNRLSGPVNASSPAIINCRFSGNYAASEGGAIYNSGTIGGQVLLLIKNCTFYRNQAGTSGGAIFIGSFTSSNYKPVIKNSSFIMNEAVRRGGAINATGGFITADSVYFLKNRVTAVAEGFTFPGSGGAVNMTSSDALFTACIFDSNSSTGNATGPYEGGGGGAVYMSTNDVQTNTLGPSEPVFISCGFYNNTTGGNTASWGGAAAHLNDAGILKPKYVNCVFAGNSAENDGGAAANFTRVISPPEGFIPLLEISFTNCTFTGNNAGQRGGALYNDGFLYMGSEILHTTIDNSILWNNWAVSAGNEIFNNADNIISYSLIKGSGGSGGGWDASLGTDAGNNIDADPLFVNEGAPAGPDNIFATPDDGLFVQPVSPAINSGNNGASGLAGISNDYTGGPRIRYSGVDMGAYETINPDEDQLVSGVTDDIPGEFSLKQNYPNPFNPLTTIEFELPVEAFVNCRVYNVLGELVAELADGVFYAGKNVLQFNGEKIMSGVYVYKITAGEFSMSRKMILIK